MSALLTPPLPPMEARSVDQIPTDPGWQYEPKWDGFRCLAFRRGNDIYLQSKSGQPLARYFPDIVVALSRLPAKKFVLDGELVVDVAGRFPSTNCNFASIPPPAGCKNWRQPILQPSMFLIFLKAMLANPCSKFR